MSKTTRTILSLSLVALTLLLLGIAYRKDHQTVSVMRPSAAEPLRPTHAETAPETAETEAPTEPSAAASTQPETAPATEPETVPAEERFLLTFAGDCTFGASPSNYYAQCGFIKTVGEDYGYPFRNVIGYFEDDEFTMVNLEGPLADVGNPVPKQHNFLGPTHFVNILTENSVEAVTLGNNHTLDYGPQAYETTRKTLESAGMPYVERDSTAIVTTKNGLRIGLYAMVYYKLDVNQMRSGIDELKQAGVDLIVVAPHWGVEGTYVPTPEQEKVGHAAIDAGADIVFGSHPHVLQPIEHYADGVIFYSLGNFSFGGNSCPDDFDTAFVQQEVIREPDGTVRLGDLTVIPASISSVSNVNNYQPTPLEPNTEAYERVMAKLGGSF